MQTRNRIVGHVMGSAIGMMCVCGGGGRAALADRPLSEATLRELRAVRPGVEATWRDGYVRSVHGVPMSQGAETPQEAADDWLLEWGEVFGARAFDYDLDWTVESGEDLAVVRFDQLVNGVAVDGGTGRVVLRRTEGLWTPIMAWCNAVPLAADDLGDIIYNHGAALLLARAHREAEGLTDWSEPQLCVYANELLGREDARLAWKVLGTAGPMGAAASNYFFVDAQTGGILGVRSGISAGTIDGTVDGYATPGLKPNSTSNPPTLVALDSVLMKIGGYSIENYTDSIGAYELIGNYPVPATVEAILAGQTWEIQTSSGTPIMMSQVVGSVPTTENFTFNAASASLPADDEETAIVNGHILMAEAAEYILSRATGLSLPMLYIWPYWQGAPFDCGGLYATGSPSVIFFMPAGSFGGVPCAAGCYRSFFAHEFGHFISDKILGGTLHHAWEEGFCDTFIIVMYNTPHFAEDFHGPGQHERSPGTAGATYPYCPPASGAHIRGQLLGGIWYDLVQTLGHAYAQDLHVRWIFLADTSSRPPVSPCTDVQSADASTVVEVLLADDDNNTLLDGTPNQADICAVFAARGITHPTYCP